MLTDFWRRMGVVSVLCCTAVALPAVMGEPRISVYALFATCIGIFCARIIPRAGDPDDYVETVFTPQQNGTQAYLQFLDRAQRSVHVAFFALTSEPVVSKLIDLHQRGVQVNIALDKRQLSSSDPLGHLQRRLRLARIKVFAVSSAKGLSMHHKFTVVDGCWICEGSWNASACADKQANLLNFVCSKRRAAKFLEQWSSLIQVTQFRTT